MSVQDLQINLTGKDVSASSALYALARAASKAASEAGSSLDEMNRRVKTSSEETSHGITSNFGGTLMSWGQGALAGILGGIAASVTSAVGGALSQASSAIMGELKSTVIDYNSQLENATIGFTTMLGSGGKATDFLNTLQAFAQRTPFQFGDLTQYAQQMIGYGIKSKDVIKDLSALGDAASGAGRLDTLGNAVLAFEQMAARGKVDLGDLNQLSNAGVPALQILANQYHVTTGKMLSMISAGEVMSSDALPKLRDGIEKGTKTTAKFGGMMDKQSATFTGAMSNIQDAMSQTLSGAFRPFYGALEKVAGGIAKFVTGKKFQAWAKEVSVVVGQVVSIVGGGLSKVFNDPKAQKAIGKLGAALSGAFKEIAPAIARMMPDLIKFGQDVFPAIVDGITTVVKHFPQFLDGVQHIVHELATWGPAVAKFIDWGAHIIGWLVDCVAAFQKWHDQATGAITKFIHDAADKLAKFVGVLKDIGTHIIQGLVDGIKAGAGAIKAAVDWVVGLIPAGARKLLGIQSPSKVFHQIGDYVGQGLTKGLLGSVDSVKSAATSLTKAITDQFKAGDLSKVAENSALATVSRMSARLQALAKQRDAVNASLSNLRTDRSNLVTNVRTSSLGQGNITGFASEGDAVEGLQGMIRNTRQFKVDLWKLRHMGIGQTMFAQLVQGWQDDPANALRTANELIANPVDLKEIVGLQRQLGAASADLGNYAGAGEYGAAINTRAGQSRVLGWQMQKVAAAGLNRAAAETHIHLHLSGTYAGTRDDLAKTVYAAFKDAVKRGAIPKNAYVNP